MQARNQTEKTHKRHMDLSYEAFLVEKLEQESLRELNEAFDEKDHSRIQGIIAKAKGDEEKEIALATTMANSITDIAKANRRGEAAEEAGHPHIANVFYDRAAELSGEAPVRKTVAPEEETPEEGSGEEEAPEGEAKVKKVRVPKEPKPEVKKPQVGDYVNITAKMILEGVVGVHEKSGGWRFIGTRYTGDRQIEMYAGKAPTRGRYIRGRGYSSGSSGTPATAYMDKTYIESLGDQTIFYMVLKKIGNMWLEGTVAFANGLDDTHYAVRIQKKIMVPNGPELPIFLSHLKDLQTLKDAKKFVMGDEDFLMKSTGTTLDDVVPGVYQLKCLNYELSLKAGEPVVYCIPSSSESITHPKAFFAPITKMKELKTSITPEQQKAMVDYLSRKIGAGIVETGTDSFAIPYFTVSGSKFGKGLSGYQASPFFTSKQAEDHIEELKKKGETENFPFSTENLKVSECLGHQRYRLTFIQLIDYAKLMGVEIKMKKFFEEKRGAISANKFGF